MQVRDILPEDRPQWAVLWQGYQEFYAVDLPDAATARTFARFFDTAEPVHALVAVEGGKLVGLVHYIFHRNTWFEKDVCYLQDLFTAPEARGKGVARALIEAVYDKARGRSAPRVYWLTQEGNETARALYDQVAEKSGFIQYRKNF
jgi:GNAT superfamily N-acetyltransferase